MSRKEPGGAIPMSSETGDSTTSCSASGPRTRIQSQKDAPPPAARSAGRGASDLSGLAPTLAVASSPRHRREHGLSSRPWHSLRCARAPHQIRDPSATPG